MAVNPSPQLESASQAVKRYFTVEEANRALQYVSRIVEDLCRTYRGTLTIQHRMEYPELADDTDQLHDEYERLVARLHRFVEELNDVGVELKDYELGLIDFPALHEGREVYLCWKRGEKSLVAWHETTAGFLGRQDISLLGKAEE